ncbi:SAM-dependent methyltransferase [candidate division GN15 bacterium]|uniref:SAM-dependent methyltransferase n=1 Tax=candidate division GN15 bacterium TaxID=2072418 RepID=A0A855X1T8_9BACT|nr:MAG: SAM-dependent methyltransferase [candidate division GN15 bacterium]
MVDLGMSPLCESYVSPERAHQYEPFYPLVVYVCKKCFLAQVLDYVSAESIFSEYAYFSSFSDSWVRHAEKYTEIAITRFGLTTDSFVVELASNDGYLLQHFVKRSIPVLGIEPAANIAVAAESRGVPTLVRFFGVPVAKELADQGKQADLLVGNNVLAQVPDLNDFVAGMKLLLKPDGVITLEFPHLMRLMEENQFDTIYHEHYSYFSLLTVKELFARHGLRLFDVEEIPTHGGSLRVYACHADCRTHDDGRSVSELGEREIAHGLRTLSHYTAFGRHVEETRYKLLTFLIDLKRQGRSIAGYGAPGKGNTLLNYCGIRSDLISYTVDRNPYKQGKYLPGSRIPIYAPERIEQTKPDFVFILPWNLRNEIMAQLSFIRRWGGQFIVPIPEVRVYS